MTFISIFVPLFLSIFVGIVPNSPTVSFDKEQYYKAFAGNDITAISSELKTIQSVNFAERPAFEGALLMKKAGVVGNPKDKLSLFKTGHDKLELEIKQTPSNTEYRLLRLMIQENAPAFLGYNDNLETDKKMIVSNFNTLPSIVQKVIRDYSTKSKYLKPELFQ
jgi:hypothetical protein